MLEKASDEEVPEASIGTEEGDEKKDRHAASPLSSSDLGGSRFRASCGRTALDRNH
jgi:hypothetical protein